MSITVERVKKEKVLEKSKQLYEALKKIYDILKSEDMQKQNLKHELSLKIIEWQLDIEDLIKKFPERLKEF